MGHAMQGTGNSGWLREVPGSDLIPAASRMAERARSAATAAAQLPPDVEVALMERECVMHKVRTALGRSAGQDPGEAPPVRIRIPEMDMADRVRALLPQPRSLGWQDVCRLVDRRTRGCYVAARSGARQRWLRTRRFCAECGIAELAEVRAGITDRAEIRGLCATSDFGITSADYALADTGIAGDAFEPAGSANDFAAAARAHSGGPRDRLLTGLDELVHRSAQAGGGHAVRWC